MEFRLAVLEDVPVLATMRWAFRAESGEQPITSEEDYVIRYSAFVRDGIESGRWSFWLVESESFEIMATMAVCSIRSVPRPSRMDDPWAYLTDCYTRPEYRNRGIGSKLLAHITARARTQDLEMILVWPSEKSADFHSRGGFGGDDEVRVLRLRDFDAPSSELCSPL